MCVAFGALAAFFAHFARIATIDAHQFELTVALACLAGLPTTYVSVRAQENVERGTSLARPLVATVAAGALLGTASQGYTAFCLAPWERLWFCDIPLGTNRAAWLGLGAGFGALGSVAAFVALTIGIRALQRTPMVLDAEERFGTPALAVTTLAASGMLLVLDPEELVPGAVVAALGLGGLAVLMLRDRERSAFVGRVFADEEPGVEIHWEPTVAEKAALCPVADVPYGELVLAERHAQESYRTTARGRGLMLLAETKEETLAPIDARQKVAAWAAGGALSILLVRLLTLQVAHH
jgi:hypothetical protein